MRAFKFLIGLLLAPVAAVTVQSLAGLLADLARTPGARSAVAALVAGAMLGAVARAALRHTPRLDILVHEMTHVVWTWLFGGRASRLRVGRSGGSVQVTRDNIWVSLAPYFFPLTTVALLAVWGSARLVFGNVGAQWIWLTLLGASWGAHTIGVVHLLRVRQPDLEPHGRLCSLTLIVTVNLFGAGLALAIVGNEGAAGWFFRWVRELTLALRALLDVWGLG